MKALYDAIYATYGSSALASVLTGGLWLSRVKPDKIAYPCGIFFEPSPSNEVGPCNERIWDSDFQFSLWAESETACFTVQAACLSSFDGVSFTPSGGVPTILVVTNIINPFQVNPKGDDPWQTILEFNCIYQE